MSKTTKEILEVSDLEQELEKELIEKYPSLAEGPTSNHYVNNKLLYEAMTEYIGKFHAWRDGGEQGPKPRVPEYIGKCILLISQNMAKRPNFANYSFIQEMISDAIENCLLYIDNFKPDRSKNPFGYFTQTVWNAFIRRIEKEKRQQAIKAKLITEAGVTDEILSKQDHDEDGEFHVTFVEHLQQNDGFLRDYEQKLETKRLARRQKKEGGLSELYGDDTE